jgi:alcohol dehydrogenase class IV
MNILLPHVLEYNFDKVKSELAELLLPFGGEEIFVNTTVEKRAEKLLVLIFEFREKISEKSGIPNTLKAAGVNRQQFNLISEIALRDGSLSFNMKDANKEDIVMILEKAY